MSAILEWILIGMAVVAVLCAVALVGIWAWARRDEKLFREIRKLEPRSYADAEHDRLQWTRFEARAKRERCDLSRGLGWNRRLLQ